MSLANRKKRILLQLNALRKFGNSATVRKLRKELKEKLDSLQKLEVPKVEKIKLASVEKSSKVKKYHRYIRMIRDNYPEVSYQQIRKMFKERKQGRTVSIPDVVWQNPSP